MREELDFRFTWDLLRTIPILRSDGLRCRRSPSFRRIEDFLDAGRLPRDCCDSVGEADFCREREVRLAKVEDEAHALSSDEIVLPKVSTSPQEGVLMSVTSMGRSEGAASSKSGVARLREGLLGSGEKLNICIADEGGLGMLKGRSI